MYEVFDLNLGDVLHTFKDAFKAHECARDMNEDHDSKMYGVRQVEN